MTQEEIRAFIMGVISGGYSATPVAWPNRSFDPDLSEFIRVTLPEATPSEQVEKTSGGAGIAFPNLIIQIFTPENTGTRRAYQIYDTIDTLFKATDWSDFLKISPPTKSYEGPDGQGYYQVNMIYALDAPINC